MSLSTKGEASHSIHLHVHVHSGLSQLYYIAGLHVGTVSYPGQKGCDSKQGVHSPHIQCSWSGVIILFVWKMWNFSTLIRDDRVYVIQLKCPNYFVQDCC